MTGISSRIFGIVGPLLLALALTSCDGGGGVPDPGNNVVDNMVDLGGNVGPEQEGGSTPQEEPRPPERLALHEAARRGLVEYEVTGRGASSGDSLTLRVRRTTAQPVSLYVAPGTVFGSGSSRVQRMVARSIAGSDAIDLLDDAFRDLIVEAYCMDIDLANPSTDDRFTAASIDERAAAILREAQSQDLGIAATQSAIWMDLGATDEDITEVFEASAEDLAAARAVLARLPRRG
jgi:hypothetical protein